MNTKVYQSGLKFMLCNAIKRLYNGEVMFDYSLDHGIRVRVKSDIPITKNELINIKNYMHKMADSSIPFNKKVISKQDAYEFFMKKKEYEKANNVLKISNLTVSLFEFEGQYNYFYSHNMPANSSEVSLFDLYYIADNEFVLIYPIDGNLDFTFRKFIYNSFNNYIDWMRVQNLTYVTDVNKLVTNGNIKDFIKKNDISLNNNLFEIAKDIVNKNKNVVLIAGPSSSGKTTTSRKLSLYLSSLGKNALALSLDDFFVNRNETPLDEFGNKDYECLEATDLKLLNETLSKLFAGEGVHLPKFNFVLGEKEFDEYETKLESNQVLVIEGLHAINPNLLNLNNTSHVYKIYLGALTPLKVDRHNYISTQDSRLIRRIIRDYRTRGRTAEASIATWNSVKCGEEKYIYPYTDTCDALYNTAYIYELGVLKVYVEPLLYDIPMDSKTYNEARRLLDNLKTFYTIPSEYVQEDSLIREFIGGSIFEER